VGWWGLNNVISEYQRSLVVVIHSNNRPVGFDLYPSLITQKY